MGSGKVICCVFSCVTTQLVTFFVCWLDCCNFPSLFLGEIIIAFVLMFFPVCGCTWCVFLTTSLISIRACVVIPPPPLRELHVQYTLYESSHYTMYGTVSSLLATCCCCLQGSVIVQLVGLQWFSAMFLKLDSAEPPAFQKGESEVPRY